MADQHAEPFVRLPGEGLAVENPTGGVITFKVMSGTSDGGVTAIDTTVPPGLGPPLHVHWEQDETIYTLEGLFEVKLGEQLLKAPAGSCVFIPRGTPHAWRNAGDSTARFFATVTPADRRFEEFFVRYSQLPPEERGVEAFARLGAETRGLEVVGPPLASLR